MSKCIYVIFRPFDDNLSFNDMERKINTILPNTAAGNGGVLEVNGEWAGYIERCNNYYENSIDLFDDLNTVEFEVALNEAKGIENFEVPKFSLVAKIIFIETPQNVYHQCAIDDTVLHMSQFVLRSFTG